MKGCGSAILLAVALIAAASLMSSGCGKTTSTAGRTSATPMPNIGSVVEAGNWRYSVRQVDVAKTYVDRFSTAKTAKGNWVIVLVQLTNIGKANFSINSFDFELWDDKGIHYNEAGIFTGDPPPGHMNLGDKTPPGVELLTTLRFDVAPGTSGMMLHLVQPNINIRLE